MTATKSATQTDQPPSGQSSPGSVEPAKKPRHPIPFANPREEALSIDVDCPVPVVSESIRRLGIGLFNGMSPEVHPRALGRILSQIRFGSTLNIAASLASPCRPTHALRGGHWVAAMEQVGAVTRAIGYKRALIVHGFNGDKTAGMDELSTLGESEATRMLMVLAGKGATRHLRRTLGSRILKLPLRGKGPICRNARFVIATAKPNLTRKSVQGREASLQKSKTEVP